MTSISSGARATGSAPRSGADAGAIPGLAAIVMAAGLGKRMRSKLAKMLHPVAGRPVVRYVVELAERMAGQGVVVVVGYQGDRVRAVLEDRTSGNGRTRSIRFVEQGEPLGTGHAVLQTKQAFCGSLHPPPPAAYLILNGDTPLLTEAALRDLYRVHVRDGATVTLLTALRDDPAGYGRVVREGSNGTEGAQAGGRVVGIVEDRDATSDEARLREVNVGSYVVDGPFLFDGLEKLEAANTQGEYYLTDLVARAVERGLRVAAVPLAHPEEGAGINSRRELAEADRVMRRRVADRWMAAGVTLHDPDTIRIDADVTLGQDSAIFPFVSLEGSTHLGEDCVIHSYVRLTDCRLGDGVVVQDCCVLREATLEDGATIGPFAHLRPGAIVRRAAKVGNFVEMKHADLGEGSKANHLTYLGDAKIGRRVNIGAGTVTCNYDGVRKYETVIEDDVFIGSDALLVAPVKVGMGALIAAGSTVTEDVPRHALAIGRAPQVNRPGWAARRRALMQETGSGSRDERQEAQATARRKRESALPRKKGGKGKGRRHKKGRAKRSR